MNIKLFLDGASFDEMVAYHRGDFPVSGFTTNPSLMRKAGVTDYEAFARKVLAEIPDRPISFEIFSDDLAEMERQAATIASWGEHVYAKIPVTTTKGVSTTPIIARLSRRGVKLNITAVFTPQQVQPIVEALAVKTPSIISVFAGRIANTGVDPMPIMKTAVAMAKSRPACEILWASTREALNCIQAEACGCHIITVPADILKVVSTFGKDLEQYSLETVQMFYDDAQKAGYTL